MTIRPARAGALTRVAHGRAVEQTSIVRGAKPRRDAVPAPGASAQAEGGEVFGALARTNTRPGRATASTTSWTAAGGGV
jgi:hypothetical protein